MMVVTNSGVPPDAVLLGNIDTLAENLEKLDDDVRVARSVILSKLLLQMNGGLLGVVVRHLTKEVMGHVSVLDMVESNIENPSVATIDGAKLSLYPSEGTIVIDGHIIGRVLELGDENQPHVDDEVGEAIEESDGRGGELVAEEGKKGNCQANANVGEDNVGALSLSEEGRPG